MKKVLLSLVILMALLWCGAVALADFVIPEGTTDIGDEAFMNSRVSFNLTIPEGVKTIGQKAFSGTYVRQAKLPASLTRIAPDAFPPNSSFEVLPGSYAEQWCIDNGYFYDEMRVFVNVENIVAYSDKPAVLQARCSYPDRVDFYRWETSTDLKRWKVVKGRKGDTIRIDYMDNVKESYVRCRASVNGVLLEDGNYATVAHKPGAISFDAEKSRALSGDAIYLEWTYMGYGMQYTLNQWKPDASLEKGGTWEEVDSQLNTNAYIIYGLKKNTQYDFTVVAMPEKDDGRELRYETDRFSLTTLSEPYSFRITESRVMGTSFYCKWEKVAMAYYTIEYTRDGGEARVLTDTWTGTDIWLYGLPKDVDFNIRITAWDYDDRYDDKKHIIASASVDARSGDYDPGITLNDITVTDGIAHLSWNELGGSTYTVYISADGGEKWLSIASDISDNYYEVNGLDCGKRYDFSVVATSGSWQTRSNTASVTIPERQAGRAEYRALLIGEVSFRGSMRAERNYGDVELIAKALSTVNTPGGSPYTVVRRKDLLDYRIIEEIELTFGDADEDDVSLLFIATHGDYKNMGRDAGCLVTVDSSGNRSYMDLYMLADALAKIKGKVIVWLGSCGSGASIYEHGVPQNGDKALAAAAMRAFSSRDSVNWVANDAAGELGNITAEKYDTGELRREGKFYVLTASRYHEMSWGRESERMNYFGKFLSEGITKTNGKMPADGNKDGKVTQNELFHYIKNREEDDEHFINQNVQTYPLDSDYVLFVE